MEDAARVASVFMSEWVKSVLLVRSLLKNSWRANIDVSEYHGYWFSLKDLVMIKIHPSRTWEWMNIVY